MERVAVIMAGGRGERLWPKSRKDCPKQFLAIGKDNKSLIVQTVERMQKLTCLKNIFIVTGRDYYDLTRSQLPELPEDNIICEPMGKNTTACIGYACQIIKKRIGDAIMMVVPSDHLIRRIKSFTSDLRKCCTLAERHNTIVTVGITPTKPETGFGYIKVHKEKPIEKRYQHTEENRAPGAWLSRRARRFGTKRYKSINTTVRKQTPTMPFRRTIIPVTTARKGICSTAASWMEFPKTSTTSERTMAITKTTV